MPIDISVRSAKAVGAAAPAADPSLPCTSGVVSPLLWNFTGFGKENLVPKLGSFLLHPVLGKMPTCIAATVPPAPTEAAVPLGAPLADGVQGAGEFLVLKIGAAADRLRARSTESGGGRAPESPRGWRPFRDHHVYGARAMQGMIALVEHCVKALDWAWALQFRFPWRPRPCRGPSLTYPRPRTAVPRKPCCLSWANISFCLAAPCR